MKTKGFSHTVIGSRELNQDSLLVDDTLRVYAVADGIGGGLKGEVASKMAVDGLAAHMKANAKIGEAFKMIQQAIYNEALTSFGEALMGTTMTSVQIVDDAEGAYANLCHAGDSRCYLFDGNLLKQLSEDHESYDENFQGSVLNSYLGIDIRSYALKIQEETVRLKAGDRLLMCSDGLYKQLTEMRIIALIRENLMDPENLLKILCEEASKAEYSDNVTVVYVEIEA
jgi:PPM family protein phosphatase